MIYVSSNGYQAVTEVIILLSDTSLPFFTELQGLSEFVLSLTSTVQNANLV
jgi:hypothetical protein